VRASFGMNCLFYRDKLHTCARGAEDLMYIGSIDTRCSHSIIRGRQAPFWMNSMLSLLLLRSRPLPLFTVSSLHCPQLCLGQIDRGSGIRSSKSDTTERTPSKAFTIGEFMVIRDLVDPDCSINRSRWSKGGWTFQEELLSRSRLFFLPDQVCFTC
jgi:hypothetical protein